MIRYIIGFVIAIILVEVIAPGLTLMPVFEAIVEWAITLVERIITKVLVA